MKYFQTILPAVFISAAVTFFIAREKHQITSPLSSGDVEKIFPSGEDNGAEFTQYELRRLRDPQTGKIPGNIRQMELEYAATLPGFQSPVTEGKSENFLSTLNWQSRGPWNVGGRTRAFAIDATNSNKLLAGSTSGGMWMSLNAGASWSPVWNTVNQSISCIAQDTRAGKTSTWYIGTGEPYGQSASGGGAYYLGNGLYKSTNGGASWTSIASTASNTPQTFDIIWDLVWNVAINPADTTTNGTIYAATYGAIMKSTNGGASWTKCLGSTTANPFAYFTDVAVSPTGIAYASLSSDGTSKGIWRSADNGVTWTNITPTSFVNDTSHVASVYGRIKIGISPSDENQVYCWAGVTTGFGTPDTNFMGQVEWNSLWKFDYNLSGGKWYNLSANLPTKGKMFDNQYVQGGYDMVVKVLPTDTAVVFLGGTNLYRSDNGFFSPAKTNFIGGYLQGSVLPVIASYANHHPDQHNVEFVPSNPSIMYSTNDGGIFKTTNDTASSVVWTPLDNGYLTSMFYTVAMDHSTPNDSTLIGGAQDNGSWFMNSKNPQTSWVQPRGGDGAYCAIANNKTDYYFSIQSGRIHRMTLDAAGNVTAKRRIDPIGGTGYEFINPFALDPNNKDRMYLAGGKNLWRNDSLTFIPLNDKWDSISQGWVKFPDTVPTSLATITALAVSKNPANTVYYGTSSQNVYRINNANAGTPTAVDITGAQFPVGAYVSCISMDPTDSRKVMVAFSNYNVYSIFYTANADSTVPTWTKVAGNLEQNSSGTGNGPSVRWVSIMPVSDGTVYLAATSTGLYATDTLKGTTTVWTQQGAATIGNSICDMIDFRTSDGLVAVATHSRGIFTTNITSKNDVLGMKDLQSENYRLNIFPNPFNSSTTIDFTLNKNAKVKLSVYDLNGRLIQTLADKEFPAGDNRVDLTGENLSTGVYYCIMRSNEAVESKKMVVIRK
ncbi:MAG TPA: T9SS type A sorting domain-containing protein [Bacteroidia bacterium]